MSGPIIETYPDTPHTTFKASVGPSIPYDGRYERGANFGGTDIETDALRAQVERLGDTQG